MAADKDYAEIMFEAMSVLMDKKIETIKFDQTINATIVDDSKAADGTYVVSTGNAKFIAYSMETAYKTNDAVMVTIPQGNYDNQKMIIGKQVDNMHSPLIYRSPFQNLVDVSNNLIQGYHEVAFWANSNDAEQGRPWDDNVLDFKDSKVYQNEVEIWHSEDNFFQQGFTQIGVQAQFSTWLNEYNTTFGNYGLAVEITFKCLDIPDDAKDENNNPIPNTFIKIITFDSNEFFGDVYNFETFYTQENVYDISEYIDFPIVKLRLFAYQRNNFKDSTGDYIYTVDDSDFSSINANIFVKDPYLCLGIPYGDFSQDTAQIMTDSDLTYYKGNGSLTLTPAEIKKRHEDNEKTVGLRWIHRDTKTDTIKSVQPGELPSDYQIRWYRFKLGAPSADQFSGAHWVRFYGSRLFPDSSEEWSLSANYDVAYSYEEGLPYKIYDEEATTEDKYVNYEPTASTTLLQETNFFKKGEDDTYTRCEIVYHDPVVDEETGEETTPESYSVDEETLSATTIINYYYKTAQDTYESFVASDFENYIKTSQYLQYMYYNDQHGFKTVNNDYITLYLPIKYLDTATDEIEITFQPNVNNQTEQLKAVIIRIEDTHTAVPLYRQVAVSNILEFTNKDEVSSQATIIDENALGIRYEDETQGNYFLYNRACMVSKETDKERRTLVAVFDENVANINKPELTQPWSYVKWEFPEDNTMITPASSADEDAVPTDETVFYNTTKVSYYIKPNLNRNATNNTVKLTVEKDGVVYSTQVKMLFGTAGTSGSDYTLICTWEDGKNAINLSENDAPTGATDTEVYNFDHTLVGNIFLMDQSGQLIDIPAESKITAEWKVATGVIPQMEKREKLIYCPVFFTGVADADTEGLGVLEPIPYEQLTVFANAANVKPEDYPDSQYYYIQENLPTAGETYYEYDPIRKEFISHTGTELLQRTNSKYNIKFWAKPIYKKASKNELVFKEVDIATKEEYEPTQRYFVQYDNMYILDPWVDDGYKEVERYFIPVEKPASRYLNNNIIISYRNLDNTVADANTTGNKKIVLTADSTTSINSLFVLEITLSNFGDFDLVTYYPIPLKRGETHDASGAVNPVTNEKQKQFIISYVEGPTEVRYATSGEVDYNKNPYEFKAKNYVYNSNSDTFSTTIYGHGANIKADIPYAGYWQLFYPTTWQGQSDIDVSTFGAYLPELVETATWDYVDPTARPVNTGAENPNDFTGKYNAPLLKPLGIYFEDAIPYGIQFCDKNGNVLWTQPIYVYQDNYPSTTLNRWNGKDIMTDEGTGTMTANGFAAGKKESDNTFTGVVLGDWSRTDSDKALTEQTGVFGFNHGQMAYALKDDGTAFFGKDGKGRIYLSGNKAQIYSANWLLKNNGMLLDIDDGIIKINKRDSWKIVAIRDSDHYDTLKPTLYIQNTARYTGNSEQFTMFPSLKTDSDCTVAHVAAWFTPNEHFWYLGVSAKATTGDEKDTSIYNAQNQLSDESYVPIGTYANDSSLTAVDGTHLTGKSFYEVNQSTWCFKECYVKIDNSTHAVTISDSTITGGTKVVVLEHIYKVYHYKRDVVYIQGAGGKNYKWSLWRENKRYNYFYSNSLNRMASGSSGGDIWAAYYRNNPSTPLTCAEVGDYGTGTMGFYYVNGYYQRTSFNSSQLQVDVDESPFYFSAWIGDQYSLVDDDENFNPKRTYYTNSNLNNGDRYITLSVMEDTYPLSIGETESVFGRRFKVNWEGKLFAVDGQFSGRIESEEGYIGGWEITHDRLQTQSGNIYLDSTTGELYGAKITTWEGDIGGWLIDSSGLEKNDTRLDATWGIFTDRIQIKATDAPWNTYFGGMGYVNADFKDGPDETDLPGAGVALYYGTSAVTSPAIYKVNGKNLGYKWYGTYQSLDYRYDEDYDTKNGNDVTFFGLSENEPTDVDRGSHNKSWTSNGNTNTKYSIRNMSSFNLYSTPNVYLGSHEDETAASTYTVDKIVIKAKALEVKTPTAEAQTGIYARFAPDPPPASGGEG